MYNTTKYPRPRPRSDAFPYPNSNNHANGNGNGTDTITPFPNNPANGADTINPLGPDDTGTSWDRTLVTTPPPAHAPMEAFGPWLNQAIDSAVSATVKHMPNHQYDHHNTNGDQLIDPEPKVLPALPKRGLCWDFSCFGWKAIFGACWWDCACCSKKFCVCDASHCCDSQCCQCCL